jgi:hypothetical protein
MGVFPKGGLEGFGEKRQCSIILTAALLATISTINAQESNGTQGHITVLFIPLQNQQMSLAYWWKRVQAARGEAGSV